MKGFIIRKPGDQMSEQYSDECIASANKFGIKVEKFDGVYSNHDHIINSKGLKFLDFPFFTSIFKINNYN